MFSSTFNNNYNFVHPGLLMSVNNSGVVSGLQKNTEKKKLPVFNAERYLYDLSNTPVVEKISKRKKQDKVIPDWNSFSKKYRDDHDKKEEELSAHLQEMENKKNKMYLESTYKLSLCKPVETPAEIKPDQEKPGDKPKKYNPRKGRLPEKPLKEIAREKFSEMFGKEKAWVDYYSLREVQPYLTTNEYLVLDFLAVRGIKKRTPMPFIKEEHWQKGVKEGYEVYAKPAKLAPRSRLNAINGLISKGLIYKKDFKDKRGILYFLNTENGEKLFELVKAGKLKREDCEQLNILFRTQKISCLDPKLIEKYLQYRSEKISPLPGKEFTTVVNSFHLSSEIISPSNCSETIEGIEFENPVPRELPIGLPISTTSDQEKLPAVVDEKIISEIKSTVSKLRKYKIFGKNADGLINLYGPAKINYCLSDLEKQIENGLIIKKSFFGLLKTLLEDIKELDDSEILEMSQEVPEVQQKPVENQHLAGVEKFTRFQPVFKLYGFNISTWSQNLDEFSARLIKDFEYFYTSMDEKIINQIAGYEQTSQSGFGGAAEKKARVLGITGKNYEEWYGCVWDYEQKLNERFENLLFQIGDLINFEELESLLKEAKKNNFKLSETSINQLLEEFKKLK